MELEVSCNDPSPTTNITTATKAYLPVIKMSERNAATWLVESNISNTPLSNAEESTNLLCDSP